MLALLTQLGGKAASSEELTPEAMKQQLTPEQWDRIYAMSQDKNLYHNLIASLFPTIHGLYTSLFSQRSFCLLGFYFVQFIPHMRSGKRALLPFRLENLLC